MITDQPVLIINRWKFANNVTQVTDPTVIYYVEETGSWSRTDNGIIVTVSDDEVKTGN